MDVPEQRHAKRRHVCRNGARCAMFERQADGKPRVVTDSIREIGVSVHPDTP